MTFPEEELNAIQAYGLKLLIQVILQKVSLDLLENEEDEKYKLISGLCSMIINDKKVNDMLINCCKQYIAKLEGKQLNQENVMKLTKSA